MKDSKAQKYLVPRDGQQKLADLHDALELPGHQVPSFKTYVAIQNGTANNLLLTTWGGLGDQVCSEPTLRYSLKAFPKERISVATWYPELFAHIPFHQVFDLNKKHPNWESFLVIDTNIPHEHLAWEFMSHCLINCVDYPAMAAFRMQLPVSERQIYLSSEPLFENASSFSSGRILIHPGKHWPSKTFPKEWWNTVIHYLLNHGEKPVLIGKSVSANQGTVNVDAEGCDDLRNKTSPAEMTWLCQRAKVLLTNDSSPMHMAASIDPFSPEGSGRAWIGYVATCKHPDYISHWRQGQWNWREVNFGIGGLWEHLNFCPNQQEEVKMHAASPEMLMQWLPNPEHYAQWAIERAHDEI